MGTDFDALTRINQDITLAEDGGDVEGLHRHLAPELVFQRANGDIVSREQFLQAAQPSGPRTLTIRSIELLGQQRALVSCVISMPGQGQVLHFHNLRLFVRTETGEWKLLAWANEAI